MPPEIHISENYKRILLKYSFGARGFNYKYTNIKNSNVSNKLPGNWGEIISSCRCPQDNNGKCCTEVLHSNDPADTEQARTLMLSLNGQYHVLLESWITNREDFTYFMLSENKDKATVGIFNKDSNCFLHCDIDIKESSIDCKNNPFRDCARDKRHRRVYGIFEKSISKKNCVED